MSVYTSGVDAYRDTTKWLTAFLPLATVISGGLLVGPGLLRSIQGSHSLGDWLGRHWILLVCGVVVVAAIGAIMWTGSKVLAAEPTDIGELAAGTAGKPALATAIGNGAAAPYFFDKASFDTAMADLANGWDAKTVEKDDPRVARLQPAVEALREWSVFNQVQQPYKTFRRTFIGGAAGITIAIVVSAALASTAAPITTPTTVLVSVAPQAEHAFTQATGCTSPRTSTFTAIAGTWDQPRLEVDGPSCAFAAKWNPDPTLVELRLPEKK